jgi:membrane peptidoglycan carboxypeptidase
MRKMLTGTVLYGTGKRSRLPISSYGKTGTSNKGRDACFIGGANSFTAGVWTGHDDMTSTQNFGGALPASIWRDFMLACVGLASFFKASDIPQLNLASYPQLRRLPNSIGDLINTLDARR